MTKQFGTRLLDSNGGIWNEQSFEWLFGPSWNVNVVTYLI